MECPTKVGLGMPWAGRGGSLRLIKAGSWDGLIWDGLGMGGALQVNAWAACFLGFACFNCLGLGLHGGNRLRNNGRLGHNLRDLPRALYQSNVRKVSLTWTLEEDGASRIEVISQPARQTPAFKFGLYTSSVLSWLRTLCQKVFTFICTCVEGKFCRLKRWCRKEWVYKSGNSNFLKYCGGGWRESYNDWLAWFWTTIYSAEHSRKL